MFVDAPLSQELEQRQKEKQKEKEKEKKRRAKQRKKAEKDKAEEEARQRKVRVCDTPTAARGVGQRMRSLMFWNSMYFGYITGIPKDRRLGCSWGKYRVSGESCATTRSESTNHSCSRFHCTDICRSRRLRTWSGSSKIPWVWALLSIAVSVVLQIVVND